MYIFTRQKITIKPEIFIQLNIPMHERVIAGVGAGEAFEYSIV